ncbi:M56 family metallopeptidase [Kitasatospora sp. NPDC096147]|uniref:M56 family metallopeptidase n=1 Tax=Kitasatospora sp. NPDC096147 TaxID=3364093 RepID=UPI0037F863D3
MTWVLLLVTAALTFPWAAAGAARRLADRLPPKEACAAIVSTAVLGAGGTGAALFGLAHVPFLAGLEQLPLAQVATEWPAALPVAALATAVMATQLVLVVRRWCEHRSLLAAAWAEAADAEADGDLLVLPGETPDAFALPGRHRRPGAIVVTTAMLRTLGEREREVLLAHERAHLTGHHHLLSVTTYLAAAVHPALRSLRPALDFHLERWADESAAREVGNRRLAAAAIARAALAASTAGPRRGPLLAVNTGPVPQRVEALLGPVPVRPEAASARAAALGLVLGVVTCAVAAVAIAYGLHEYVELAAEGLRAR